MTLFVKQLPSLFNGVSQQPATLRLPSQCEEAINCSFSVLDGFSKRPPTEHVAVIDSDIPDDAKIHILNRDVLNRFTVVITDGDLKVFDMTGAEKFVSFPSGKAYLANETPRNGFACVSVADYTFIVNKSKTVAMKEVGDDLIAQPATYWWLNRSAIGGESGIAAQRQYTTNPAGSTFRGNSTSLDQLAKDVTNPHEGDVWKVGSGQGGKFTGYYVRYTGGAFQETVLPGLRNLIDATTMPHALVNMGDDTFSFGPFSWAPRHVGDEDSNKNPTFVGRKINDVFFNKNRLSFVSDENVIESNTGDFGNFYRLTITDILADQVIDISPSTNKVSVLNFAVPFSGGVMLFSDQTQFYLGSSDKITSSVSVSADVATEYTCSTEAKPAALGTDLYFASEAGQYSVVWEYFVSPDNVSKDASDVTKHVPSYVLGPVTRMIPSSNYDSLFLLTGTARNRIYNYKFYWQGDTKAQSAWGYWSLDDAAVTLDGEVMDKYLYLLVKRPTDVSIERISLQPNSTPDGSPFEVFLDRRAAIQGTYLPGEDKTEFVFPYAVDHSLVRLVHGHEFTDSEGALIDVGSYTFPEARVVKVTGDHSAGIVYGGHSYTMKYTFSEQFVTDSQGTAINTGRTQVRSFTLYYVKSAFFRTVIDSYGDGSNVDDVAVDVGRLADFTGKVTGQTNVIIGKPVFSSGAYTFQVYGPADTAKVSIINDSHVQSTIQKAEVELFYFNRAKVR